MILIVLVGVSGRLVSILMAPVMLVYARPKYLGLGTSSFFSFK
jgi:hypothetical protein